MNYQQAKQFLTIVKHMNLSKAASELYISQPALSLALGRLESELGVKLFYRDGKKLIISPAGEKLYDSFRNFKDAHDRLTEIADDISKHETQQSISVGFCFSAMFFATLYMSGRFNAWKNITIKKIFADTEQLQNMLKTGMIDFAVTCPPIIDDRISNQNILTERFMLAVSSGHPLANHTTVTLEDLKTVPIVGLKKHHPPRMQIDELCKQNHFQPVYAHECDYPEYYAMIAESAYSDQFVAFVPEAFFERTYKKGYQAVPFANDIMSRSTSLSWLTERKLNLEYKGFLDDLIEKIKYQYQYHVQFSEQLSTIF